MTLRPLPSRGLLVRRPDGAGRRPGAPRACRGSPTTTRPAVRPDKNLPIVIDFSTQECHWCRMLETTTFRDPAVVKVLSRRFVALHLDAEKEADLAQHLKSRAIRR